MICDDESLRGRFQELLDSGLKELDTNEDGEHCATICQNEWVRILLVRNQADPSIFIIDVEMAIPNLSQFDATTNQDVNDYKKQNEIRSLMSCVKTHIDYLISLQDAGFVLEMLGREFLCTATLEFTLEEDIKPILSDVLIPPNLC